MGQYKNGKWEPTFGDVQAGVSDYAPGERSPQEALSIKDKKIAELERQNEILGLSADRRGEAIIELEQELSDKAPHYMDCIDRERKLTEQNQRLREALLEAKSQINHSQDSGYIIHHIEQALEGHDE